MLQLILQAHSIKIYTGQIQYRPRLCNVRYRANALTVHRPHQNMPEGNK